MGNQASGDDSASYTTTDFDADSDIYSLYSQVAAASSRASSPVPMEPPEADLSHLTEEERAHIASVLERARLLQDREEQRVRELETEYTTFAENIIRRSSLTELDKTDVCPICLTTEIPMFPQQLEAAGIDPGIVCGDCERRICSKCGSYYTSVATKKEKWLCHMCQKRRHLYTSSGMWYHGHGSRPCLSRGSSLEEVFMAVNAADRRSSSPRSEDSMLYAGAPGEERNRNQLEHSESLEDRPEHELRSRGVGQSSSDEDGSKSSDASLKKGMTQAKSGILEGKDIVNDDHSTDNISPSSTYDSGLGASTKISSTEEIDMDEYRTQSSSEGVVNLSKQDMLTSVNEMKEHERLVRSCVHDLHDITESPEEVEQHSRLVKMRSLSLQRQDTAESLDEAEMQRQLLELCTADSLDEDEMQRQLLELAGTSYSLEEDTPGEPISENVVSDVISRAAESPVGDRFGAYGEESPIPHPPQHADIQETITVPEHLDKSQETVQANDFSKERESASSTLKASKEISVKHKIELFENRDLPSDDRAHTLQKSASVGEQRPQRILQNSSSLSNDNLGDIPPVSKVQYKKHQQDWAHESLSDSEIKTGSKKLTIESGSLASSKPALAKSDSKLANTGKDELIGLDVSLSIESGIGSMDSGLNGKDGQNGSSPTHPEEGPEIRYQSFHDLRNVGKEDPKSQHTPQYTRPKPANLPKRRRSKPVMEIPLSPIWDVEVVTPESDHPAGEFQSPEYSNPELAEESPIEPIDNVDYVTTEDTQKVVTSNAASKGSDDYDSLQEHAAKYTQQLEEANNVPEKSICFGLQKRALDVVPEESAELIREEEIQQQLSIVSKINQESEKKEGLPQPCQRPEKIQTFTEENIPTHDVTAEHSVSTTTKRTEKEYKYYIETFKQHSPEEDSTSKLKIEIETSKGDEGLFNTSSEDVSAQKAIVQDIATKTKEPYKELDQKQMTNEELKYNDSMSDTGSQSLNEKNEFHHNIIKNFDTIATVVKDRGGAIFVVSKYEEANDEKEDKSPSKSPEKPRAKTSDAQLSCKKRQKPVPLPRTSKLPVGASGSQNDSVEESARSAHLDERLPILKTENGGNKKRIRRTLPSTMIASKSTDTLPLYSKATSSPTKTTGSYIRSRSLDNISHSKLPQKLVKQSDITQTQPDEQLTSIVARQSPTTHFLECQISKDSSVGSQDSILESPITPELVTETFSDPKPSSPTLEPPNKLTTFNLASPPKDIRQRGTKLALERNDSNRKQHPQTKTVGKTGERSRLPLRKQKESVDPDTNYTKPGKPPKPPVPPRRTTSTGMGKSFEGKLEPTTRIPTTDTSTETESNQTPKHTKSISTTVGASFDERRIMGRYSPRTATDADTSTYDQLSESMRQKKEMLSEAVGTSFDQPVSLSKTETTETGTSPQTPTIKKSTAVGSFEMDETKQMVECGTSPPTPTTKTHQNIATGTSFDETCSTEMTERGISSLSSPRNRHIDSEQSASSRTAESVLGTTGIPNRYSGNHQIFVCASQQRKSTDRKALQEKIKALKMTTASIGTNTEECKAATPVTSDDEYHVPMAIKIRNRSLHDSERRSSSLPSTPSRIPRTPSRSASSDTEGFDSDMDISKRIRRKLPEIPPGAVPVQVPKRERKKKSDIGMSRMDPEKAVEIEKVKQMLYKKAEELKQQQSRKEQQPPPPKDTGKQCRYLSSDIKSEKKNGNGKKSTSFTIRQSAIGGKSGNGNMPKRLSPPHGSKKQFQASDKSISKRSSPPHERFGFKRTSPTQTKFEVKSQSKKIDDEDSNLTSMVHLTKSEEEIIREIEKQISDTSGTEYRAFEPAEIRKEVQRKYADYVCEDYGYSSFSQTSTDEPVSYLSSYVDNDSIDKKQKQMTTTYSTKSELGSSSFTTYEDMWEQDSKTGSEKRHIHSVLHHDSEHKIESTGSSIKEEKTKSRLPVRQKSESKSETRKKSDMESIKTRTEKTKTSAMKYQYVAKPEKKATARLQVKGHSPENAKKNGRDKKDEDLSPSKSPKSPARVSPQSSPQRRRHRRQNSDPHVQKFSPIKEDSDFESQLCSIDSAYGSTVKKLERQSSSTNKPVRRRKDTPTVMPLPDEIITEEERMSNEGEMIERNIKAGKREQLKKEIEKRKKQMEESAKRLEEIKIMRRFDSDLDTVKMSYSYDDKLRNIEPISLGERERQYGSLETMALGRNIPDMPHSSVTSSGDIHQYNDQHIIFPLKSEHLGLHGIGDDHDFPLEKKPAGRQIHYDEITGSAVHIVQPRPSMVSKEDQQKKAVSMRRSKGLPDKDTRSQVTLEAGKNRKGNLDVHVKDIHTGTSYATSDDVIPPSPTRAMLSRTKAISVTSSNSDASEERQNFSKQDSVKSDFSSAEYGSYDFRLTGRETDWSEHRNDSDEESYGSSSLYKGPHKSSGIHRRKTPFTGPLKYDFETKTFLFSRDPKDRSVRGNGLGLKVVGGKHVPRTNNIGAYIAAIYPGSVCEQTIDLREGDQVLEWNGVSLSGLTYEEVQQVIRSSDGEVELKVKCGANMCESPRRPPPSKQPSESYQSSIENIAGEVPNTTDDQQNSPGLGIDPNQLSRRLEGISRAQSQSDSSGSVKHSSPTKWPQSPTASSPSEPSTPKTSRKQARHQAHIQASHKDKRHHRVSGEIQLQMRYETRTNDLEINIIRARGLAPKDFNGLADPFVKVYLLPGRSAENKRRTKYISRTLNPEWEQVVFYRNIHPLDLQKKSVEFTVWDYDRFSPNDFMGEVLIDLTDNHYLDNRPRWFKLHEHDENNSAELPKPKTLSPTMSRRRQHSTAAPIALQKSRSHTDVMDDQPIMEHRQGSRIDQKARSLTQLAQTESSENAKDQPYGTTPLKAKRPHMQSSFWKEDPISKTIAHVTDCPVNLENERQKTATTTPITFSSSTLPSARSSSTIRTRSSRKDYSPDEPHDAARVALAAAEAVVLQLQPALTEQESQYYNAPLQIQKPYISDETIQLGASQLEPSTDIPIRRTLSAGDATPSIEHLASTSILRRRHGYGSSDTTDSSETGTPRSSRHSSRDRSRSKTSPHRTIREESVTSTISSYYTATDSAMPSMNYGQADSYHMPPLQPITSAHAHTEEHGRDMSPGTHQYGKESKRSPSHHHHQHRSHSRSKHEKHRSRSIETNQFPTEHMGQFSTHSLPSNVSFTRTPSETYIPNLDCRSEAMLDAHTSGYSDTPWIARQPPGAQDIHMNTKAAMYTRMLLGDLGPGQVIDPEMPRQSKAAFLKKANAEMTGEIKLVLRKDSRTEGDTFYVEIVQARKITYKFKVTDHLPDLYVKAYLIVGNKRISKKKTRICKHDLEPTFSETFQYNTNVKGLALQIMLWADGGRFGRNLLIGEALVWLDTVNFTQGAVDGWYKLFLSPLSPSKSTVRTP